MKNAVNTHNTKNGINRFLFILVALYFVTPLFSAIYDIPILGGFSPTILRLAFMVFVFKKLFRSELKINIPFFPLFCVWLFLMFSALWSEYPLFSLKMYLPIFQYFLIILIANECIAEKKDIDFIIRLYVVASFIISVFLLIMVASGITLEKGGTRLTVLGQDQNTIAYFLVVGLVFVRDIYFNGKLRVEKESLTIKIAGIGLFVVLPVAIVATGSRTGFFIYILVLASFFTSFKGLSVFLISLFFVGFVAYYFDIDVFNYFEQKNIERIMEADEQIRAGDLTGRVEIWKESVNIIMENPFWGTGLYTSQFEIAKYFPESGVSSEGLSMKASHNTYIQIFIEAGLIGFLIFIYSIYSIVSKIKRYSTRKNTWILFFLVTGVVCMTLSDVIFWPVFFMFSFLSLKEIQMEQNEDTYHNGVISPQ